MYKFFSRGEVNRDVTVDEVCFNIISKIKVFEHLLDADPLDQLHVLLCQVSTTSALINPM